MISKTIKLPQALINSIQERAHYEDSDFSKLVRDTLKEKFGLLRIHKPARKVKGA